MKNVSFYLLMILLVSVSSCSKEKKFFKAITGTWTIDKTYDKDSEVEITGEFTFTKKQSEITPIYSTLGEPAYEGSYTLNGIETEFLYEYHKIITNNAVVLTLFNADGSGLSDFKIQVLTKNEFTGYFVNSATGDIIYKFYMSK